jgi:hypothetical protein
MKIRKNFYDGICHSAQKVLFSELEYGASEEEAFEEVKKTYQFNDEEMKEFKGHPDTEFVFVEFAEMKRGL